MPMHLSKVAATYGVSGNIQALDLGGKNQLPESSA